MSRGTVYRAIYIAPHCDACGGMSEDVTWSYGPDPHDACEQCGAWGQKYIPGARTVPERELEEAE